MLICAWVVHYIAFFFLSLCSKLSAVSVALKFGGKGLGLGEEGEFKVQMFSLLQMPNRIYKVEVSTSAPFSPNPY